MNNDSNINFPQNSFVDIQYTYSSEFHIGWSTSEFPLFIWLKLHILKALYIEMDLQFRKQEKVTWNWWSSEHGGCICTIHQKLLTEKFPTLSSGPKICWPIVCRGLRFLIMGVLDMTTVHLMVRKCKVTFLLPLLLDPLWLRLVVAVRVWFMGQIINCNNRLNNPFILGVFIFFWLVLLFFRRKEKKHRHHYRSRSDDSRSDSGPRRKRRKSTGCSKHRKHRRSRDLSSGSETVRYIRRKIRKERRRRKHKPRRMCDTDIDIKPQLHSSNSPMIGRRRRSTSSSNRRGVGSTRDRSSMHDHRQSRHMSSDNTDSGAEEAGSKRQKFQRDYSSSDSEDSDCIS